MADGGPSSACQAAGHEADGGPSDHGFAGGGVAFVVTGQPPVCCQPCQRPLDRPPARQHGQPLPICGFADDVHRGARGVGRPDQQPPGRAGIGENQPAGERGEIQAQQSTLGCTCRKCRPRRWGRCEPVNSV
jgi:hypothetical protein